MKRKEADLVKFVFALFISAYLINLLWEVAHSMLYSWSQLPLKNDVYFYIPRILGAALGDAFAISFIFLISCFLRKGFDWICFPERRDYTAFLFLGLIFAVLIEARAMLLGLWSYNEHMPLVFGIGLTPLIQLAITGMIALFLTARLICRKKR